MREDLLKKFFVGEASSADLAEDLRGALIEAGPGVTHHHIVDMNTNFAVEPAHLVRACDAVLSGELDAAVLRAIGFCLLASDHFTWDGETASGAVVSEVALDWSCPEANFPLTPENVREWRAQLLGRPPNLQGWGLLPRPRLPTVDHKISSKR